MAQPLGAARSLGLSGMRRAAVARPGRICHLGVSFARYPENFDKSNVNFTDLALKMTWETKQEKSSKNREENSKHSGSFVSATFGPKWWCAFGFPCL